MKMRLGMAHVLVKKPSASEGVNNRKCFPYFQLIMMMMMTASSFNQSDSDIGLLI